MLCEQEMNRKLIIRGFTLCQQCKDHMKLRNKTCHGHIWEFLFGNTDLLVNGILNNDQLVEIPSKQMATIYYM